MLHTLSQDVPLYVVSLASMTYCNVQDDICTHVNDRSHISFVIHSIALSINVSYDHKAHNSSQYSHFRGLMAITPERTI